MKSNTKISSALAHISIVLSGMYIVFFLIDRVNQAMAFIANDITKTLLLILTVINIYLSIRVIGINRRLEAQRLRKEAQARAMRRSANRNH